MNVSMYGRLGQLAGSRLSIDMPSGGCSVAELRELLVRRYPALDGEISTDRVRACVDDEIVSDATHIDAAQSVEFFPPVSGG
jgi:molybdopterin converting factor small subunit